MITTPIEEKVNLRWDIPHTHNNGVQLGGKKSAGLYREVCPIGRVCAVEYDAVHFRALKFKPSVLKSRLDKGLTILHVCNAVASILVLESKKSSHNANLQFSAQYLFCLCI